MPIAISLLASVFLTSCGPLGAQLAVLEGNYYFSRGEYQDSIVNYLPLLESGELEEYVSYNLGNVYQALGEGNAALRMWEQAEESEDGDLRFMVTFNRGVFYFDRGNYQAAYNAFKEALRLSSGSVPAKINLELTLLRLNAEEQLTPQRGEGESEGEQEIGREALRVLEFVRRKEKQRWEANRSEEETEFRKDW